MYNKIFFEKSKNYSAKLYYAHIPKTAGTYTKKYLEGLIYSSNIDHGFSLNGVFSYSNISKPNTKYYFKNYFEDFSIKKPIIFSTFRNPFDLLCSYYMHSRNTGLIHSGWLGCNDYHNFKNFKNFIISFVDPNVVWHIPHLNNFLLSQLFDKNHECISNFIITFEKLHENLKVIKYNLLLKQLKKIGYADDLLKSPTIRSKIKNILKTYKNNIFSNFNKKIRKSQNKVEDYRYYYDNEMIDNLYQKCSRELKLFGYEFDKINPGKALLKNDEGFFDPKNLKYDLYSDKMKVIDD